MRLASAFVDQRDDALTPLHLNQGAILSTIEMWAAYCAGMEATFEVYKSGCDRLATDSAYWEDTGLPVLLRVVEMSS